MGTGTLVAAGLYMLFLVIVVYVAPKKNKKK